jgi:16S rRNA (cytosine967-C5)-methyltransferase
VKTTQKPSGKRTPSPRKAVQKRPEHKTFAKKLPPRDVPSGLPARRQAVELIEAVLEKGRALDDALSAAQSRGSGELEPRDRALARLIATTVLRRLGEIDAVLAAFIARPLPETSGRLRSILRSAVAQLLFLETPPHAAISLAVDHCRLDRGARRFDGLANAVLRRVAREGLQQLEGKDTVSLNVPSWLLSRWVTSYGEERARRIAGASLKPAALDVTVKSEADTWAERLGGVALPTGSVRLHAHGRIDELDGFAEGAWWVQDAAAALPARLLGDVEGQDVADLCAAPGGKTAQLAAAGARVTAVDVSEVRIGRLRENLTRLGLSAETVAADVAAWSPGRMFDGVLLDAPCTATGTLRRHPDILRLKRDADVSALVEVQARLLDAAAELVRPGGRFVYCTCSLEPEEGESQAARFLARHPEYQREPISAAEIGGVAEWVTVEGELRTLPDTLHLDSPYLSGIDGFFAARFRRAG